MKKLLFILALCLSVFASAQCPAVNLPQNGKWKFMFSQCFEDTLNMNYIEASRVAYFDANKNLTYITYAQLGDSIEIDTSLLATRAYVNNKVDSVGALAGHLDTLFLDPYKIFPQDTALNSWESLRGYNNDTIVFRIDPSFVTATYLGFGNSSWGFAALRKNTTGYHIAAFGGNTFEFNTTGYQNSGFGNRVFYKNTTGYQLLGAGQGAGFENTTGVEDVYLGFHAGLNLNASNSVFVGSQCGQGVLSGTATDNTGGGRRALVSLRHGTQNAVWGRAGFTSLTDGDFNWGGGDNVGLAVTDANYLCLTGFLSGYTLSAANATTTGSYQSFYGAYTGQSVPTQLNYVGAWGYASTVGRDSTYRIGGPALRSVVIGNDSGDYTLHVFGTAAITQTPISTNGTDNIAVMDGSTGQIKTINRSLFALKNDTNTFGNLTTGTVTSSGGFTMAGNNDFAITGRGLISFTASGRMRISNNTANGFDRLQLGGTSSAYPSIARQGQAIRLLLADTSGYAELQTGQLSVNGAPQASAAVTINSTTQGFLPPVMTAAQGSAIATPAQGLMIFVTTTNGTFTAIGWWGYDGSNWVQIG